MIQNVFPSSICDRIPFPYLPWARLPLNSSPMTINSAATAVRPLLPTPSFYLFIYLFIYISHQIIIFNNDNYFNLNFVHKLNNKN